MNKLKLIKIKAFLISCVMAGLVWATLQPSDVTDSSRNIGVLVIDIVVVFVGIKIYRYFFKKWSKPNKNEEDYKKTLKGLRETVISFLPDQETKNLSKELNSLMDTNVIVKNITEYKKKLSLIPNAELNNTQNLWLLAYEASEARLEEMSKNKTDYTIESFTNSMFVLNKFI